MEAVFPFSRRSVRSLLVVLASVLVFGACGDDTAVECVDGGECTPCPSGACEPPPPPECVDGVRNGDELDVDCGGSLCDPCPCATDSDCATGVCRSDVCVLGPTAGFAIRPNAGPVPLPIELVSQVFPGTGSVTVEYDYGEGAGWETASTHTYDEPGVHIVTQRVTDTNDFEERRSMAVVAGPPLGPGCHLFLEAEQRDYTLSADRLAVAWWSLAERSVRSDCVIEPGSGVFYFEATTIPPECDREEAPVGCLSPEPRLVTFGVGTGEAPLDQLVGDNSQSFGVHSHGRLFFDDTYQGFIPGEPKETYGFVVDYRAASPVVHVVAELDGASAVTHSFPLDAIGAPLHAMVGGVRRKVGMHVRVDFGDDPANRPFALDPEGALVAAGLNAEAEALTLRFGERAAGFTPPPANERPTLELPGELTIPLGVAASLEGAASDPEDGDLSARIYWEDLATPPGALAHGVGARFDFTPTQVGLHPVRATIFDDAGGRRQGIVPVRVIGTVEQYDPVALLNDRRQDPRVGRGLVTDGTRAGWSLPGTTMGMRANQGMIGEFWYFEANRLGGEGLNRGIGVTVWEGDLRPYDEWSSPPSAAINMVAGVWRNLVFLDDYDLGASNFGFAVDYRAETPTVYVIVDGEVATEVPMPDTFVPLHPMVYGDSVGSDGNLDIELNFGASPFRQDPCSALRAHGLPEGQLRALELGWGEAHIGGGCR